MIFLIHADCVLSAVVRGGSGFLLPALTVHDAYLTPHIVNEVHIHTLEDVPC